MKSLKSIYYGFVLKPSTDGEIDSLYNLGVKISDIFTSHEKPDCIKDEAFKNLIKKEIFNDGEIVTYFCEAVEPFAPEYTDDEYEAIEVGFEAAKEHSEEELLSLMNDIVLPYANNLSPQKIEGVRITTNKVYELQENSEIVL